MSETSDQPEKCAYC